MSSTDLESLESKIARSRRMDACLVGSVVVLFVLMFSGFAVLFTWNLRPKAENVHEPPQALRSVQDDMSLRYKGQNFAYMRAKITNGKMSNGVMYWEPIRYGEGVTLGSGYEYNTIQSVLSVKQAGTYFLYVQFNVTCTYKCDNETLTITFKDGKYVDQLSCTLELPAYETVVKKCWTVIPHMDKDSKLLARIHSDKDLTHRVLEVNSSGFGIFRVDGPGTD